MLRKGFVMKSKVFKNCVVLLLIFSAAGIWAQEDGAAAGARERRFNTTGGFGQMGGGRDQGALIMRLLDNAETLTAVGVSADQAGKLKTALKEIEIKMIDIDAEIAKASLEQTDLMAKLLADEAPVPEKTVLEITEKIGKLRIEQAKLQIKRLIIIREHLTPVQITEMRNRARANFARMRGGDGQAQVAGDGAAGDGAGNAARFQRGARGEGNEDARNNNRQAWRQGGGRQDREGQRPDGQQRPGGDQRQNNNRQNQPARPARPAGWGD